MDYSGKKFKLHFSGEVTITSGHFRNFETIRTCTSQRKGYTISNSTRRKILASAFILYAKHKNNVIFPTLTFPNAPEGKINPLLNKFLTGFRSVYGLNAYIWTRENQKNGKPHFHLLADFPYTPISNINNLWCKAIGQYSPNAVRLPPKHKGIVSDIKATTLYMAKYMSKTVKEEIRYPERCYGISYNLKTEPVSLNWYDVEQMGYDGIDFFIRHFDYCDIAQIKNFFENHKYFIDLL